MQFISQEEELTFKSPVQSLYFYASWMPYHKKMITMIEKMQEKHKGVDFFAIDVDHFNGLCKRFQIDSIPTVLLLKEGTEIKRINGIVLTSAFKSAFADICKS